MAHYPQSAAGLNYITYPAGPGTGGATLTASGTANTKGSYTELTSSSGFECNSIAVTIRNTSTTEGVHYLFDIATGAGGAETVVVPNLSGESTWSSGSTASNGTFVLPLTISSATRIAARCQASTGSQTMAMSLSLVAAGDTDGPTSYTDYGADTATSDLTQVDPGGVADTKGSYTEITASTSAVTQILSMMSSLSGNGNPSTSIWMVDIATGAAGSEVVLVPDIMVTATVTVGSINPRSITLMTYIAASTRLAVRASCAITDATDRLIYIALLAATAPAETGGGTTGRQALHAIEAGAV